MAGNRYVYHAISALGELLITLGVLVFLFAGWQLWWTDVIANQAFAQTGEELTSDWAPPADNIVASQDVNTMPPDSALVVNPPQGEPFALIHIPRFGADWDPKPVMSGTSSSILKKGVGYYEETAPVGGVGNFSIAGHRTTYGRPFHNIEQLQPGDPIVVETKESYFVYKYQTTEIVLPTDVDVIAPVPGQPEAVPTERMITLTACHPKFSAKQRIIAHGVLDHWQPKSEGIPAEISDSVRG